MRATGKTLLVVASLWMSPVIANDSVDDLADEGAELYAEFCATCHGDDVDGLQQFSDTKEDFIARLEGETDNMPDFTDFFEPEEVDAMYHFLTITSGAN